ncbi:hypothetical protein STRCR_1921 [Streptococcus criceti HS-6]|uniref:Uncharacterized protein n=1 Tax=Streptococcus criceti HS-6 TaxID=873449 RepID=G5JR36_STRCG|nr:hypothetical protein STRCR_1921 [Streptococcus criceti HS-6]
MADRTKKFTSEKSAQTQEISQEALSNTLDWAYSKTVKGILGQPSIT